MGLFLDLAKGIPINAVLRERLEAADAKYATLQAENGELREQLDNLKEANRSLRNRLEEAASAQKFEECRGVLWKRGRDGAYEKAPYCPRCKLVMSSIEPSIIPYGCSQCDFRAPFKADELREIMVELAS